MLISMTAWTLMMMATASVMSSARRVLSEGGRRNIATLGRACVTGAAVAALVESIEVVEPEGPAVIVLMRRWSGTRIVFTGDARRPSGERLVLAGQLLPTATSVGT
jgi:hypothetical protein